MACVVAGTVPPAPDGGQVEAGVLDECVQAVAGRVGIGGAGQAKGGEHAGLT